MNKEVKSPHLESVQSNNVSNSEDDWVLLQSFTENGADHFNI